MKKFYFLALTVFVFNVSFSQTNFFKKDTLTLSDAVLGYYKGLYPKQVKRLAWLSDVDKYFYATDTSYIVKKAKKCKKDVEITLSEFKKGDTSLNRIPYVEHATDKLFVYRGAEGVTWYDYRKNEIVTTVKLPSEATNVAIDFDRKQVAYTIDNNLYMATITDSKVAVVENTDENIVSGQAIHRYEFGITKGIFWSPDGTKLAFYQKDETDVADYPLLDITTTPGSLNSIKYPMAGQKSEYGRVGVYDLAKNKVIYLNTKGAKDDYVTNLTWGPKSERLYIFQLNRGQDDMHLNSFDASSGNQLKNLVHETHEKWVEPEYPLYFNPSNEKEAIYLTEKKGYMTPYLLNIETGELTDLVNISFPVTEVLGFTKDGKYFDFMATGTDGRNNLGYRLEMASKTLKLLSTSAGTHSVQISASGDYASDAYSDFKTPGITEIVKIDKDERANILTAENPLENYEKVSTSMITLKSEDGFNLYGRLILPPNFDKEKKYPVLIYVYGGPHAQLVTNSWLGGASLWMHWLANQDYIVFTLDGRGSANRGFAFENVIHRKLGENEMKDQLVGVEYLKKLAYVDSTRMAVHGWSFGGFMTTSLMLNYPDVFTTGVAGGPVMDWKWYEVMYGERYMDMPEENPDGYKQTSTIDKVTNLKGKLMTIHGTIDDVVVMQHNLAFLQACVSNGVQVDFFAYPMHPHNVRGKDRVHLMEKVLNYIIENNQ